MNRTAQVAIVGAGPGGLAAALQLSRLGIRDVLLLDRQAFPRDKTCGSAVSPRGIQVLKELGIWDEIRPLSYRINGIRVTTSGERVLEMSAGDEYAAIVCCRRELDHAILRAAQRSGVELLAPFRVERLLQHGKRNVGVSDGEGNTVHARFLIVANGANTALAGERKRTETIQSLMGWWDGVAFTPHMVEMIFDRDVAPYYLWLFPESATRVNIGICYQDNGKKRNARRLFKAVLDKHYGKRLVSATAVREFQGHPIRYSYRVEHLHAPGKLIVGEAGRMTHPGTAEGIYQAMQSGIYAAGAIADVISGKPENDAFAEYEQRCRKQFEASFAWGKWWKRAVNTPALDVVASVVSTPVVKRRLARFMATM